MPIHVKVIFAKSQKCVVPQCHPIENVSLAQGVWKDECISSSVKCWMPSTRVPKACPSSKSQAQPLAIVSRALHPQTLLQRLPCGVGGRWGREVAVGCKVLHWFPLGAQTQSHCERGSPAPLTRKKCSLESSATWWETKTVQANMSFPTDLIWRKL